MSKAEQIRILAGQGLSTAEIAQQLGVSYNHAYNVLRRCDLLPPNGHSRRTNGLSSQHCLRPVLTPEFLLMHGFDVAAEWLLDSSGKLGLSCDLPDEEGVYAMVVKGRVHYVGVSTRSLKRRFGFYARPGQSQRTSIRLNALVIDLLQAGEIVEVLVACPRETTWNGLPVHLAAGLEQGLIRTFELPWNKTGR